jgi:F-type H+-transporting ATPase subunit b
MEQITQILIALQGIIIRALPTFFLVILLHWYLKKVLFQPMDKVLDERRARTEGAREAGERALERVKQKLAAYEKALGDARAAIYRDQEAAREKLRAGQSETVAAARARAGERVAAARTQIEAETATARVSLAGEADRLAEEIAGALVAGRMS